MEEPVIYVKLEHLKCSFIRTEKRDMCVAGKEIRDGEFHYSIQVPLKDPRIHLLAKASTISSANSFVPGDGYIDEHGQIWMAVTHNEIIFGDSFFEYPEFISPTKVIRTRTKIKE